MRNIYEKYLKLSLFAQFAPGKFAARVHFLLFERCFKNIAPGCNCAHIFEVQFVHMNAKRLISIRFDWEF